MFYKTVLEAITNQLTHIVLWISDNKKIEVRQASYCYSPKITFMGLLKKWI